MARDSLDPFGLDIPLYALLLPTVAFLLYLYGTWPFGQWKSLGIVGPSPEPFVGNLRQMISKGYAYTLWDWSKTYGKTYGIYHNRCPVLVTSDIDMLKEVMVRDFSHFTDRYSLTGGFNPKELRMSVVFATGGDWRRIRGIITPTFSSGKLRLMDHYINRCGADLADSLRQVAERRGKVGVKEYFGAFTLDVIAGTGFGLQVNSQKDHSEPFITAAQSLFSTLGRSTAFFTFLSTLPLVGAVIRTAFYLFRPASMQFLFDAITKMINDRRQEKNDKRPVDFLQLLINAEVSDTTNDGAVVTQKRLAKDEILGQAFVFFVAGYETTATTLQFLAYNLALYPEIQERVVQEIKEQLGDEDPSYDTVGKLKYLEHTINETLRLFPPAVVTTRRASETVTIKGVTIPKGSGLIIPICEVLRDPEHFPEPEKFSPERWEGINKNDITFLSFGFGPRVCIGMRLALLEVKMATVHMLRAVKFNKTPDLPEKLQFKCINSALLQPTSPIMIEVQPRQATNETATRRLSNGEITTKL